MSARNSRFGAFSSRSGRRKAAGAIIACTVMLLAGCGGSGGSAADVGATDAPVVRGNAECEAEKGGFTATAPLGRPTRTVSFTAPTYGSRWWRFTAITNWSGSWSIRTHASSGSIQATGLSKGNDNLWVVGDTENGCAYISELATTESSPVTASSPVTVAATVPGTPPAPTVVAGTARLTATVAAGTSGGTPTSYTVTAYTAIGTAAGICTVTGAFGSCDVTPLTGGNTYTVKATAKNAAGTSGESGASSPVTVVAPLRTVTFNANGGENTMGGQTANQLTPLKANEFTKSGDVFDGWATTSTGDKAYGNGDNYSFDQNATLYARWVCPALSGSWTVTAAAGGVTRTVIFTAPTYTSPWTKFTAKANAGQSAEITSSSSSGSIQVRGLIKGANNTFIVTGTTADGCTYTSQSTTP
jgi:hypothetical protein